MLDRMKVEGQKQCEKGISSYYMNSQYGSVRVYVRATLSRHETGFIANNVQQETQSVAKTPTTTPPKIAAVAVKKEAEAVQGVMPYAAF